MAMKKKAAPEEKENGERWLVSYADFVTLLLGVFIIMYSMAAADAQEAGSSGANQANAIAALASAFGNSIIELNSGSNIIDINSGGETLEMSPQEREEMIMEQIEEKIDEITTDFASMNLDDAIEVIIDETGVHIRIKDTVLFNSGKYKINKEAEPIMHRIGNVLKELPNNKIQVEGHTDDIPINTGLIESNWELGSLRAVSVTKMLIHDCALNPKNLCAISYGEFQPIETNKTVDGRGANRRVEITILRNYINWEEFM